MNVPATTAVQLFNPLALTPGLRAVAQTAEPPNAIPGMAARAALQAQLTQALSIAGDLADTSGSPFGSSFQPALQTSPAAAAGSTLLLQALSTEDRANTSGEIPFAAPYQLGLQAIAELAAQVPNQNQPAAAQPGAAQPGAAQAQELGTATPADALPASTLDALAGTTEVATAGVADPTSSTLFQAHSGAMASSQFLAPTMLNAAAGEGPAGGLRVAETYAGAATSAFSEGRPANANLSALNVAAPGRPPSSSSTVFGPTDTVAPAYGPEGMAVTNTRRLGTSLDLTG